MRQRSLLYVAADCRALLRGYISRMQGFTIQRCVAAWHHFRLSKDSRRHRAKSAALEMQLSRKRAMLTTWHAAWLRAVHKRALMSKGLAHMRDAIVPAVFDGWRQHWMAKSSLRGMAQAARKHIHLHRKHLLLRAWHTIRQTAQHKKALLSRAVAFMRHAVLPAAFQEWHQYSHAKRSRRSKTNSAMQQILSVRQRKVLRAWRAGP